MKIDTTKLLLIGIILILGWQNFFRGEKTIEPNPVTVNVPEKNGSTGLKKLEPEIKIVPVYIPRENKTVNVDEGYKNLYEKSRDSLERLNLYLEAIKIKNYNDTLVDNKEILIKGYAKTRGSLLDYKVDYKLKEKNIKYKPKTIIENPKLSLGTGISLGVPTQTNKNFNAMGTISLMNKKGNEVNFSYDTEKRIYIGIKKNFKILK